MEMRNEFVAARRRAGLDQSEFGELVGLSGGRICQLECNPEKMPMHIARVYHAIAGDGGKRDIERVVKSYVFSDEM